MKVTKTTTTKQTHSVVCPECKKKIKGSTYIHCVANFRLHFQIKHPKTKFEEIIGDLK